MFTVEQRGALRDRLLRLAQADQRVVAGAAVGSLAVDGDDRFSDLDLTFGIADGVPVIDVLDDWRGRWVTTSTRCTLSTSSAVRPPTESSCFRTSFSATS